MSKFALKILSVCPRSLLDKTFIRLLGAEKGVLLAELNGSMVQSIAGWNKVSFTDDEQTRLREAYSYLKGRRAIIDYKPTTDIAGNEEEQIKVSKELLSENTYLALAICDDELELPESVIDKFYSREKVLEGDKLSHKEVKVEPMEAAILANKMTPYAFDCTSFKIVDPYTFEISRRSLSARMDFLVELCDQIEKYNTYNRNEIFIEVVGRCYKYWQGEQKEIEQNHIKMALSNDLRLKTLKDKGFRISFVGLDDRDLSPELQEFTNDRVPRLHKRFFMTEKYIFSLDYPFKTEPQIQNIIWFGTQISRRDMDLAYRYRSSVFDGAFEFKIGDVWFRE